MAKLRGRGLGMGRAMGTAAVIRMRGGIALAPPMPARVAELLSRGGIGETPDVILIAEEYRTALSLLGALPWAHVVGIAAERAEADDRTPPVPAVVDIRALLDSVQDDMLFVVDAENGVALADPDGMAVAAYQAEHEMIAPRRRLHLDSTHLPATTDDGHVVEVAALVTTPEEVANAIGEGADMLYIPFDCPLLPADSEDDEFHRLLFQLVDMAFGKPLAISDDYGLPMTAVVEAGSRADITLAAALYPQLEGLGLAGLVSEIAEAQNHCFERDVNCRAPRLAVNLRDLFGPPERDAAQIDTAATYGARRVVLSMEHGGELLEQALARISGLVGAANSNLLPFTCRLTPYNFLDGSLETSIRCLVGVGVATILTTRVAEVKAVVRQMNYSECEEAVLHELNGDDAGRSGSGGSAE